MSIKAYYRSDNKDFTLAKGDCLELLPNINFQFDMIFADPPYFLSNGGISVQSGKQVSVNKGDWDKSQGFEKDNEFNYKWLSLCREKLKENGTIWISGTYHNIFSVAQMLNELDFRILNCITWAKTNPPPNLSCKFFTHSTEFVLWARKNKKVTHYYNYELMKEIKRVHEVQDRVLKTDSRSVSEVCEMLDKESNYYLKTNTYYPMVEHQTSALNSTGAPWDMNMTSDFDCERFYEDQYKLFLFPALFSPSEKIINKIDSLRKKGKSMLYFHAPYYAVEDELSVYAMEKYTGISFEKCVLKDNTIRLCIDGAEDVTYKFTNKTFKGDVWFHSGEEFITPIFSPTNLDVVLGRFEENGKPACGIKFRDDGGFDAFTACAPIPVELLREIYKYANIFSYVDKSIPVYTSAGFECVYNHEGGVVKLYRPKPSYLVDCFSGERYYVDKNGTEVVFNAHETKFFMVEEQ